MYIGNRNLYGSHNRFGCHQHNAQSSAGSKHFAHEKRTEGLEGAPIGAAAGVVIGLVSAWLLAIQTVTIPALAPLVAAGPVLAALAGAGGALGWLVGVLAGMRIPEYVAKRYAGRIRRGGSLLSIHCDSQEWCERAKKTLKDTGAREIVSASESAADYGTTDKLTERAPAAAVDRIEHAAQEAKKQEAARRTLPLGSRNLWLKLTPAVGSLLGLLLLVESVAMYYQVSRILVVAELRRGAQQHATPSRERLAGWAFGDPAELSQVLEDSRRIPPIRLAGPEYRCAGTRATALSASPACSGATTSPRRISC